MSRTRFAAIIVNPQSAGHLISGFIGPGGARRDRRAVQPFRLSASDAATVPSSASVPLSARTVSTRRAFRFQPSAASSGSGHPASRRAGFRRQCSDRRGFGRLAAVPFASWPAASVIALEMSTSFRRMQAARCRVLFSDEKLKFHRAAPLARARDEARKRILPPRRLHREAGDAGSKSRSYVGEEQRSGVVGRCDLRAFASCVPRGESDKKSREAPTRCQRKTPYL